MLHVYVKQDLDYQDSRLHVQALFYTVYN